MSGIPRLPKCEDAACNLLSGHLGEHEIRSTFAEREAERERERRRHVRRWYEQDQIIRELREALREIAEHPHCIYDHPTNTGHAHSNYGIGCADGHRCAATVAKIALERANVSAATRNDSVVADGVTLPVGEKPALRALCENTKTCREACEDVDGLSYCLRCGIWEGCR